MVSFTEMSDEVKETAVEGDSHSGKAVGLAVLRVFRNIFIYLLAICIIIAALIFAADRSNDKSIFGYRYYTVLTPSMEPELSVGDLVIVRVCDADEIEVDDVITFNPSSDYDTYLTHRVT
ncbi:MAG: S26 family signal peptidase [Ruminococcus sp.]|nr:S26 family signal peptidase [Ruminococcus sp.]